MDSGVIDYCREHNVEYHYITEIGTSYFEDEVTMTSFVVPDNITNIGSRAFAGCVNLERINLNETSVISDNAFVNAGLTEIQIPSSVTEIGNKAFYNNSGLTSLEFKGDSTLTTIGESAFAKTKLVDVVVPESVATISRGAFNISTLEAIGFDGMNTELAWDESNVAVLKNSIITAYAGSKACEYAIAHKHPLILKVGYEADGVTSYERNEGIIDKLVAIDVGPNLIAIGNQAFEGAKNLSEVMFDENSTLTTLGDNAFAGTALTEISLPESVTAIGKEAFADCESLKTVSLGSVKVIPDGAFRGCLALADIANGNTFTAIGANAFRGTALETFTGGSALTRIGENAFADSALKKLTIENPNTVFPEGTLIPEGAVIRGYTNSTADLYSQTYLNTSCESTGKPAYQITFDTQGGQGGTEGIYAVNGEELSSITVPTKTDCAFDGYYTSANGGGTKYFDADGKAVKAWTGTANATLYANWIHDSYTVVYDKNGGSGDMEADVFDTNTKYNLSQNKFTKGESRFVGWSTDKDAKTASLTDKAEVKNLANAGETVTLYAVWKSASYTVTFHSNNGSGVSVSQTIGSDKKTALKKNAFEKEGSTFIGWSTSSEAESPEFYDEEAVNNLADYGESIDLYAVWSPGAVETYTVKFNPNGGSMEALSVTGYKGYELKVPNVDVTREGFTFVGWSKEKGSSVVNYRAGDVMDEEDMTLYAVWETIGAVEYSIVVHTQKADGSYESANRAMTADVGDTVTLAPECDFVVDNGYYVEANQSELSKTIGENTTFNIYLNRTKAKVVYNVNADNVRMEEVTQEGALWGSMVTLGAPMPERDGYIFVGWGTSPDSEEAVTEVILGENGTTVYAIWKEDSAAPTAIPTAEPTADPTISPTATPTATPAATNEPTPTPTATPNGGSTDKTGEIVTSPIPTTKISIIPDGTGKSGSTSKTVRKVTYQVAGSYATVSKVSANAKSVTIGKTVTINGKKYKVKAIAKNAFKGKKKLKKIVIQSPYLTKVGKNAFKGISKKAKIYVPKKQYKKYKKLIAKKSTGYGKTMSMKKK